MELKDKMNETFMQDEEDKCTDQKRDKKEEINLKVDMKLNNYQTDQYPLTPLTYRIDFLSGLRQRMNKEKTRDERYLFINMTQLKILNNKSEKEKELTVDCAFS